MPTKEIDRDKWPAFFDGFSRQHDGWLVTLEILAPAVGAQQEAVEISFEGISISSANGESEAIAISLGKNRRDHVTHTITHPTRVWLQQTTAGADQSLEIESADGAKTLLHIRSPMLPEFVDGVVMEGG